MNERAPIVAEFNSEEAAGAHDAWFRAKVAASLADARSVIAHDDAMTQVRAIIEGSPTGRQER